MVSPCIGVWELRNGEVNAVVRFLDAAKAWPVRGVGVTGVVACPYCWTNEGYFHGDLTEDGLDLSRCLAPCPPDMPLGVFADYLEDLGFEEEIVDAFRKQGEMSHA